MNNTVTLCGSTKFLDQFNRANIELTKRGLTVITISMCLPRNEQDNQEDKGLKELLDLVHLNKILKADAIFVIGNGYIGKSTAKEILWADMQGKAIITEKGIYDWDEAANHIRFNVQTINLEIIEKARQVLANG